MKALPIGAELRARLRELFELDCTSPSGLRWKVGRQGVRPSGQAGCLRSDGYWCVSVDNKVYLAHRLIWALTHDEDPGDLEIDHIDRNPVNNDPDNLRLATGSENTCNSERPCTNTSGHKGVNRHSQQAAWRGKVELHGKKITKCFSDSKYGSTEAALAAAVEWVRATREKLHGEFARHA